jgi:hypothetical protein
MVDVLFALSVFSFGFPSVFVSDVTSVGITLVVDFLDTLLFTGGNSWKGIPCIVIGLAVIEKNITFPTERHL